mgnify:FL=1
MAKKTRSERLQERSAKLRDKGKEWQAAKKDIKSEYGAGGLGAMAQAKDYEQMKAFEADPTQFGDSQQKQMQDALAAQQVAAAGAAAQQEELAQAALTGAVPAGQLEGAAQQLAMGAQAAGRQGYGDAAQRSMAKIAQAQAQAAGAADRMLARKQGRLASTAQTISGIADPAIRATAAILTGGASEVGQFAETASKGKI